MDYALGVLPDTRIAQRLRFEVIFNEVVQRHQFRRARARQQIAARVFRMAHADVAKGIDNALVGDDLIGKRKFLAGFSKCVGHRGFPLKSIDRPAL